MNNEEKIVDAFVALLTFLWILFGAFMIGLTLSIIKGILLMLGIETNL